MTGKAFTLYKELCYFHHSLFVAFDALESRLSVWGLCSLIIQDFCRFSCVELMP